MSAAYIDPLELEALEAVEGWVDRTQEGIRFRFLSGVPYPRALAWAHGGFMAQLGNWNKPASLHLERTAWAIDNGCFSKGASFRLSDYYRYLDRMRPWADTCMFAVAPDVPFNHAATWELSRPTFDAIRKRGYKAALAVQNGVDPRTLDYAAFDAVFIAGDYAFKTSQTARRVVLEALERGLHCHVARRNSQQAVKAAYGMGAHTVDGTFLAWAPDTNWLRLQGFVKALCPHAELDRWGSDPRFARCRKCGEALWKGSR